jgi:hypothetical protein
MIAPANAIVINEMLRNKKNETTRQHLLHKFWGEFDASDLDKVEITLEQANIITISNTAKDRYYQLTDIFLNAYKNGKGPSSGRGEK